MPHTVRSMRSSCSYSSVDTSLSQPLSDDELVELSSRQQQAMFAQANETIHYVLESMQDQGPSKTHWRPKGIKKDVAYYVDDRVGPDQYRFCCVGETTTRTEDIMKLFVVSDTETLVKNNRIIYDNVLDARVVSVLEKPTRFNPFKSVYVRYTSFATPKLMDDRDMCVVVATDVYVDDDGATIGYCLWDSVELPECPEMHDITGLTRSRVFRSGFFCHTTPDDGLDNGQKTKIVYLVGTEGGGPGSRLAAWLVMEKCGAVVGRLCSYFRRQHLDPASFRPRSEWPSARCIKHCRGCFKNFNSFSTRHHCVACGEVFCKACYVKENIDIPGIGITPERFCFSCLDGRGLHTSRSYVGEGHHMMGNSKATDNSRKGSSVFTFTTARSTRSLAHLEEGEVVVVGGSSFSSKFSSSSSSVNSMR